MIRNIRLSNWRAYEELDLPLTRPVTFFVAPNGVGKTSLVEAVRWGLLGTPEDRSRGRAVRSGHESATVQLDLNLLGYSDVRVTRSLKRNGTSTFDALVGDTKMGESQYRVILGKAWAADPELLDALIFGPATSGRTTGFPIRDHLAQFFGIDVLFDAAAQLSARRDVLATQIKSLRGDLSGTDEAIENAARLVTDLEADREAAAAERRAATDVIRGLEATAALGASWQRYREDGQTYSERIRSIVAEMTDVLDVGDLAPRTAIEISEREAIAALDESITAKTAAEVRAATAATAADLLATNPDRCPTCLRSLTDHERAAAIASHGDTSGDTRTEIERRDQETAQARQRLTAISNFGRMLNELREPSEPDRPDPGPEAASALSDIRQRVSDLTERHGALTAQHQAAQRQLADLQRTAAEQTALVIAAREDLLLEIGHKTLNAVADRYLTERIEPLAHEIGRRWKIVFGSEGLRFGSDGRLSFSYGDMALALDDLSGGERATALLVTRLLLADSATRVSTIWFDEPLEHLDPRRRAAVAQTMVRAAQAGTVSQILVTTYEEGLARRLAVTAPDAVELIYVRTDRDNS